MENMGYYMDHRLQDGHFVMNVYKKYQVGIKVEHLYKCDDVTINKMLPDLTMLYNAVCT
jgi:hypothetical protein